MEGGGVTRFRQEAKCWEFHFPIRWGSLFKSIAYKGMHYVLITNNNTYDFNVVSRPGVGMLPLLSMSASTFAYDSSEHRVYAGDPGNALAELIEGDEKIVDVLWTVERLNSTYVTFRDANGLCLCAYEEGLVHARHAAVIRAFGMCGWWAKVRF